MLRNLYYLALLLIFSKQVWDSRVDKIIVNS